MVIKVVKKFPNLSKIFGELMMLIEGDKRGAKKRRFDVILMRGLTPIFISCKIGEIKEIEPYKLWTVAERFGGKNVKKVLIASDFKRDNEKSENSFLNRAKEMGITFIANATEMTPTQWKNVFKNMV